MISRMNWLGLLTVALCYTASAQDARLDAIRSSLASMRGKQPGPGRPRGATPELTVTKHALRDWVESRLATLTQRGDVAEFERQLNSELRDAGAFCGEATAQPCPEWTGPGFLGHLKLRRSGVFLIVQTAVGIECGDDESAYVYGWSGEGWRRVWETEQNTYTEKGYQPQTIHSVLISPYNKANDYLVLTLGSESWCSSTWHRVYYRAFWLGPDLLGAPLLEGAEWANVSNDPPIQGSVTPNEVLVQFAVRSIDVAVLARTAVRHYRIIGNEIKRIDPFALRPRDFVDEWLVHEWKDSAIWSESANRPLMRDSHRRLHKDVVQGEFIYPTMHCKTPDLWQVGVDFSDPPPPIGAPPKGTYFLVRWRPPYQFTMVQVGDRPWPACVEEDRAADEEHRTMFPGRERR